MKRSILACFYAAATWASLSLTAVAQGPVTSAPPATAEAPKPTNASVRLVENSTTPSGEALVSMTFDETPIADVIKAFRDATGANIISSGTNLQGSVSVRLDNVPWRKGLMSILEPQGLQLVEQPIGSGIYVVSVKTVEIPLFTQTFSLSHAKADDVARLFASTLGKTASATPFPSANVVIITATEKQLAECEKIIAAVDKPRPQVYIEARFAQLTAGARRKLGMDWTQLGETYSTAAGTGWGAQHSFDAMTYGSGSAHMTYKGTLSPADLSLALNAFDKMSDVNIFSNPKIIVANEEVATVDMTTKEPNLEVTVQQATSNNGNDTVTTKLAVIPGKEECFVGEAFYSYGIVLKVTPRVSASGLITVEIEPSISDKDTENTTDGYFTITGAAAKYPVIKMQRMKTVFTMQTGTTAVIGGLSRTTETSVDSGIPFLRKLPWIGPHVFGWKNREKEQKEIIIFVTVGLADPVDLQEDVGMPKNAILGRDILSKKLQEPGDRSKADILTIDNRVDTSSAKAKAETRQKEVKKAPAADAAKTAAPTPAAPEKAAASAVEKKPAAAPAAAPMQPLLKTP